MVDFFYAKHLFCYTLWFILAYFTQRYKILEKHQCLDRKWYLPWCIISICITCFSLTFILSHLKLLLILWDTLWCLYHLPDSSLRFSLWITQLLCSPFSADPAKSSSFILPPAHSSHTRQGPSRVGYQSPDVLGWLRAPSAPGIFSLPLFALQYSFDKYDFFVISGFCSCKSQCLLISFHKICINLPAHLSSCKIFVLPKDWQVLPSHTFFTCMLDSSWFF